MSAAVPINTAKNLDHIDIFLSAANLPLHFNTLNSTVPFAVLYEVERTTNQLIKIGTTPKVNDLNPVWTQSFGVQYLFEVKQLIVVKVFSVEGIYPLEDESKHRFIGEVMIELASVLCGRGSPVNFALTNSSYPHKALGAVSLRAETRAETQDLFVTTFSANNLVNKEGFFSKSDPFIVLYRSNEDGKLTRVYESSVVMNSLNPRWARCKIPMSLLCNGDIYRPLKLEIYDHERSGKHVFMGEITELAVHQFISSAKELRKDVIEPKEKVKRSYRNSGVLVAADSAIERHHSFPEYIRGGLQLNFIVGIDFTGSNGDPRLVDSLHYVNPLARLGSNVRMNQYEEAISAVGSILEPYCTSKEYDVFGFGARVKNAQGEFQAYAEHCFPIYGGNSKVVGVEGILKAYHDAIPNVLFSGPTLFGPLLSTAAAITQSNDCTQAKPCYTVLLILTDGVINDMESTMNTLIQASGLPMSVIIVGVGNADFKDMERLDSDGVKLKLNGQEAVRDIVQFVPYKDIIAHGPSVLAQQILAEIPNQICYYMEQKGISPLH